ncbi:MAG: copper chaperone PCu(A)C [Anaerolineales bacterium]|nr:copper chaperone PCu(A)C [Anaerolineales bacterium]
MKRIMELLSILLGLTLSACQARSSGIEARDVWARAALKDGNGAVYMILHNHSSQPDELVGASADIAQGIELHKSEVNDQGVMVMLKQDSISLPARDKVQLQPGGYHIMLLGLTKDLKEGDTFDIVLKFKSHPDLPLQVTVRAGGTEMHQDGADEHGNGTHQHPISTPTP